MNKTKKKRGLRRYYKNLYLKNDLDTSIWKDLESPKALLNNNHIHFDKEGLGNKSFNRRLPHLNKLFRHFDLLADKTKILKQKFQLYAILLDYDSSSDALFLHIPNPNNSQFPFKISDLKKSTTLRNTLLDNFINKLEGYEKLYGNAGEAFCLLYKKNSGISF